MLEQPFIAGLTLQQQYVTLGTVESCIYTISHYLHYWRCLYCRCTYLHLEGCVACSRCCVAMPDWQLHGMHVLWQL